MESLQKQEIIRTPEAKGLRTKISDKPVVITANELPVRLDFQLNARRTAAVGHYESEPEYRQAKEGAVTRPPAARRTRNQQADAQPADPALILQSLRLPADSAGTADAGWAPPDGSMAVGPAHLLIAVNAACAVYDKSGRQLLFADLRDWFGPVIQPVIPEAEIFNPKVLFDQQRGCWLMAACASNAERTQARFLLAVSHTSDPLNKWWVWSLDASVDGSLKTSHWADGLGLAVDNSAVYLSANMFDQQARFVYAKIRTLFKREVYTGSQLHAWDYWDLRNPNGTPAFGVTPALNLAGTDVQHFLNALPDGKGLVHWSLQQAGRSSPHLSRRHLATLEYRLAPNGKLFNSDTEVETGDTRLSNVVFRNGSLWTAHTVSANWGGDTNVAAIQWFQINPITGSVTQQGVYGTPHAHYFCPSVMVDRHNRMMLVFNRTGETEFPAIRFTGRRASDRANTLQASALLKQSPVPGGKVWSACSGASLDPSGSDFWIIGQYSIGRNEWATWIGETAYAPRATDYNTPSVRSRSRGRRAVYA